MITYKYFRCNVPTCDDECSIKVKDRTLVSKDFTRAWDQVMSNSWLLSFFTPQLLHKHTDTALVLFTHSAGLEACTTHTHAKISYLAKTGLFRKDKYIHQNIKHWLTKKRDNFFHNQKIKIHNLDYDSREV